MRRLVLAVTPQEALRLARAIEEGRAITVMRNARDFSPCYPPAVHGVSGSRPLRRYAPNPFLGHYRGQSLPPTPLLVLPRRTHPLLEKGRSPLLRLQRRKQVSRHLGRRSLLHRSPLGLRPCPHRFERLRDLAFAQREAGRAVGGVFCLALTTIRPRNHP